MSLHFGYMVNILILQTGKPNLNTLSQNNIQSSVCFCLAKTFSNGTRKTGAKIKLNYDRFWGCGLFSNNSIHIEFGFSFIDL